MYIIVYIYIECIYIHIYIYTHHIQHFTVSLSYALAFESLAAILQKVPHLRDIPAEVGAGICGYQGGAEGVSINGGTPIRPQ